jgi:hypothetical protein
VRLNGVLRHFGGMRRTVVLRGGPLDGHIREVDEGTRTAYFPYLHASSQELERLGIAPASEGFMLVLVYKEVSLGMPVWRYAGINHAPIRGDA